MFYVLSGTVEIRLNDAMLSLAAGDFVSVPSGATHAYRNPTDAQAVMLNIGTPAGHEHFSRDADALARSGRFNPQTAAEVCQRHDIELVV